MKKKKIIKIILMVIFLIILSIDLLFGYIYEFGTSSRVVGLSTPYYRWDFYKEEKHEIPDTNTSFFKRYYHEEYDTLIIEDMSLIENNVEKVKDDISVSLNKLQELDNSINIEFDYKSVTHNDYYDKELVQEYDSEVVNRLSYYDVDEHILYVISLPE